MRLVYSHILDIRHFRFPFPPHLHFFTEKQSTSSFKSSCSPRAIAIVLFNGTNPSTQIQGSKLVGNPNLVEGNRKV